MSPLLIWKQTWRAVDFECLSCGSCGESMPLSEEKPQLSDWPMIIDVIRSTKYRVRTGIFDFAQIRVN